MADGIHVLQRLGLAEACTRWDLCLRQPFRLPGFGTGQVLRGFPYPRPSTIATSASVSPYNPYTNPSTSASNAELSATGSERLRVRIWVTRDSMMECCSV